MDVTKTESEVDAVQAHETLAVRVDIPHLREHKHDPQWTIHKEAKKLGFDYCPHCIVGKFKTQTNNCDNCGKDVDYGEHWYKETRE